jgi:hypothetical protein
MSHSCYQHLHEFCVKCSCFFLFPFKFWNLPTVLTYSCKLDRDFEAKVITSGHVLCSTSLFSESYKQ